MTVTNTADPGPNPLLLAHLAAGGSVVTATRRQARLLTAAFNRSRAEAGLRAWRSPDVVPIAAWAAERWAEAEARAGSLPLLLAEQQAEWPWRMRASMDGESLLDPRDLAAAARRAWIALRRYGGQTEQCRDPGATRDQQAFAGWAHAVEHDLDAKGWLDPGCLPQALTTHAARVPPGPALLLAGFRELPPNLRALVEAFAGQGWNLGIAPLAGPAGRTATLAAPDPAAEIDAMLSWLRERLGAQPGGRYAVYVADLDSRRFELERAFESVLQPELELPGSTERDRLFDFAGGPPLASLGVVDAALAALESGSFRLDLPLASRLLRSRYLGPLDESETRTRLDGALRAGGVGSCTPGALATRARAGRCEGFARCLEESAGVLRGPGRRAPADLWATAFGAALAAWGWPGGRPLGSDEYQAAQALREHLSDLAALARLVPAMTLAEARSELARLARAAFQPERGEASVIVYDTLEAPGIGFDGLWATGMTAADWPRAAAPEPFIPIPVQARLGMPGATAEAVLQEAVDVTQAWIGSACESVFSWPLRRDDAALEPSRVLPVAVAEMSPPARSPSRARIALAAGATAPVADDAPPPVEAGAVRGGSRILDLQAKCPFRAFAELRLGADRLEQPGAGIDARVRGQILHRALEFLGAELPDEASLRAASAERLEESVELAISESMRRELPAGTGESLEALEREWQRAALAGFVSAELGREPYAIVATEQRLETTLAGLPLRLRVDRVDRVREGLVVIDYKTGRCSTTQWRGARPDAPQLPLYAVLRGPEVQGAVFAAVGPGQTRYRGVASVAGLLPGVEAAERFRLTEDRQAGFGWSEIRARWTAWLAELARAFLEGEARVDPKLPQTCRGCHLGTLCRVRPAADAEAEAEVQEYD